MSAVRIIGHSLNLNIVPFNTCSRSGPASSLLFRHTSLYLDAALQTRLTLPGLFGFSIGCCGKYHSFPKVPFTSDSSIFLRIPFLHLYLLTVDTNSSGLGPFGILAPVSKADPGLSCSCSVGLALVHSTAFPLRTARL